MKLREIIGNLLDSKDEGSHEFRRLWNLGVFGMKAEFNLDVKGHLKTVLLTLNPNKTVQLPCDYVKYSKIGIVNDLGEFVTFKRNNQLTAYHQDYFNNATPLSNVPTLPTAAMLSGLNGGSSLYSQASYLNYNYGGTSFNLFGLGSGTADIGQYKVDEWAKIILFDPNFTYTQVLLEYLSDGEDDNEDYDVDIRMAEAVRCYLRWSDVVDRPKKASQGTVDRLWHNYSNSKRLARMRINPVVMNEIQNAERRSWKLVAKA